MRQQRQVKLQKGAFLSLDILYYKRHHVRVDNLPQLHHGNYLLEINSAEKEDGQLPHHASVAQ